MLHTSLAIDPEGLGGPLVNLRGEVVGLVVPTGTAYVENNRALVGPISALPINLVMNVSRALTIKNSQNSPWIGVSVLELTDAVRRLGTTPKPASPSMTSSIPVRRLEPASGSRAGRAGRGGA